MPGVRLRLTLRGHAKTVFRIAWSPDGRWLASPSEDNTIRIWDAVTGEVVRTLEEHTDSVLSVAWSPDGRRLASASNDKTVRLWDAKTGQALQTIEEHAGTVKCVAWSPDGRRLASASDDKTVRLWDAETGEALRTLDGHSETVYSVVCGQDPSVLWLASGGEDKAIRIWDAETGRTTNVLEGHTQVVQCVAISTDACLIASKGGNGDNTVRLWRCDTWQPVAVLTKPASDQWPPGVAFHPHEPLLATVGSDPGTKNDEADQLIHIWELNYAALLGEDGSHARQSVDGEAAAHRLATLATADSVLHATAKIVLVGDSGVGKTGLGWRFAKGEFKKHASTHGQQFWVLDQLNAQRKDGTQCEAVLWDLAGQPDYRLIHALHVADADLAVILFDPTHSRDPLGSVHYWLGQLPAECPKILVPARIDRGSPNLTTDELDQFCRQHQISGGFVETSAAKDIGLDELLERMKDQIPWDQKTAVTTTATFKRIKDFVLSLKEDREGRQLIVTPTELREMLERRPNQAQRRSGNDGAKGDDENPETNAGTARSLVRPTGTLEFTDAEMLTAVERVASHGYVRMLNTSDNQTRILLVPELLNNLAASFILEARRNPKGLGAIEGQRVLDDGYDFPELDGLSKSDHDLLIDATVAAFLENRLSYRCFREHAGETRLLVFLELMNLKKPLIDDLSYSVSGATENIYAALVVTLGYTNTFQRSDQWHNQARYEFEPGLICGFRR